MIIREKISWLCRPRFLMLLNILLNSLFVVMYMYNTNIGNPSTIHGGTGRINIGNPSTIHGGTGRINIDGVKILKKNYVVMKTMTSVQRQAKRIDMTMKEHKLNQNVIDTTVAKWKRCLLSIQNRIVFILSNVFGDTHQDVILIDPAYHDNIGDNLLSYGEMILLEKYNISFKECGLVQARNINKPCGDFKQYVKESLGVWHAGGNWGDLWGMQRKRFDSIDTMLKLNFTVIGMPQSLYYGNENIEASDSKRLNDIIKKRWAANKKKVVLSWRQEDSYNKATKLYPSIENRLVPDIAFMIGPIKQLDPKKAKIEVFDLLFLLRKDKESVIKHPNVDKKIQNILNYTQTTAKAEVRSITYTVMDWYDCLVGPKMYKEIKVMQQLKNKNEVFDFNERFTRAASMFAKGKVVITDRLHGSIFALLSHKPHIYIDQMYNKIEYTRRIALNSSTDCLDKNALMYDKAENLTRAVELGVRMLSKYELK